MAAGDNRTAKLAPLELTLELIRALNAGEPFAFQFKSKDYVLRHPDGRVSSREARPELRGHRAERPPIAGKRS